MRGDAEAIAAPAASSARSGASLSPDRLAARAASATVPQAAPNAALVSQRAAERNLPERLTLGLWVSHWLETFPEGNFDESRWDQQTGKHGWGNNELQDYVKGSYGWDEDGFYLATTGTNNNDIRSARLNSKEALSPPYRVDVRAKLPDIAKGAWPAIWMLGDSLRTGKRSWPQCGEIDMMEWVAYDPTRIHATIHTDVYNHIKGTQQAGTKTYGSGQEAIQEFRDYRLDVHADKMFFFIDGELIFTYSHQSIRDMGGNPDSIGTWPFSEPHYLFLNTAFGGNWGGAQGVDPSTLPIKFHIKHVHFYKGTRHSNETWATPAPASVSY
mmetsp:Transcript_14094/g.45164  ORF Transcript_14094/g.45164 Transcript_14094/m.45164 type:complete len:327 (+) Transcript_14094:59-1039(+)